MSEEQIATLVAAAVRAVLAELRGTPAADAPAVQVLIGAPHRLLDAALASLGALTGEARLEAILLSGERQQVTRAHVAELLPGATISTEPDAGCPLERAAAAAVLVVASLDRTTLMRTVLTVPEGFGARWLLEGLVEGKPVVFARDTLEIAADRATPQLRQALAAPLGTLESYGAELVPAVELAAAVRRGLASLARNAGAERRILITEADVDAAGGPLIVPDSAIVTPLAWDRARELGVVIQRLPR